MAEGEEASAASREALASTTWLMSHVLAGLKYPAQRWQLLAQADINGVDGITRERLRGLPVRAYQHTGEVASTILDGGPPDEPTKFTPMMKTPHQVAGRLVGVAHQR